MKIYYQGFPGAYGNKASLQVANSLQIDHKNIIGVETFGDVFEGIQKGNIGVLPIENSYAGSIYENFYHLIDGDYTIIGEIYLDIRHCLLGHTTDISQIKKVYSHPQALMQCEKYLKKHNITPIVSGDTAGSAKMIGEKKDIHLAAIASDICQDIYNLKKIEGDIQDQDGNTTRFFVIVKTESFTKKSNILNLPKNNKISICFKTKDTPSALYKCLGAFATRFINLTKIESLRAKGEKFEYIFWVDLEKNTTYQSIESAFEELQFFAKDFKILGKY